MKTQRELMNAIAEEMANTNSQHVKNRLAEIVKNGKLTLGLSDADNDAEQVFNRLIDCNYPIKSKTPVNRKFESSGNTITFWIPDYELYKELKMKIYINYRASAVARIISRGPIPVRILQRIESANSRAYFRWLDKCELGLDDRCESSPPNSDAIRHRIVNAWAEDQAQELYSQLGSWVAVCTQLGVDNWRLVSDRCTGEHWNWHPNWVATRDLVKYNIEVVS